MRFKWLLSLVTSSFSDQFSLVQGNLALYCTHSLRLGDHFSSFISVLEDIRRYCLSYITDLKFFIPVLITQLYIPGNVYLYYPILVLAGKSIAVALLLPWSMLPDVLDEFMLQTGTRQDAIFYSFYVFYSQFAIGVGLGLSQLALEIGGYQSGECDQPESVGLALRCLIVPGPVIFTLIALLILWRYPIDEKRRKEIKEELEKLRADKTYNSRDSIGPPPPDEYQSTQSYESIGGNLNTDR